MGSSKSVQPTRYTPLPVHRFTSKSFHCNNTCHSTLSPCQVSLVHLTKLSCRDGIYSHCGTGRSWPLMSYHVQCCSGDGFGCWECGTSEAIYPLTLFEPSPLCLVLQRKYKCHYNSTHDLHCVSHDYHMTVTAYHMN